MQMRQHLMVLGSAANPACRAGGRGPLVQADGFLERPLAFKFGVEAQMIRDRAFMRIASHREAGSTATSFVSRKTDTTI